VRIDNQVVFRKQQAKIYAELGSQVAEGYIYVEFSTEDRIIV